MATKRKVPPPIPKKKPAKKGSGLSRFEREPKLGDSILSAVAIGLSIPKAAQLNGVTKKTVYNWINRGLAGESPFDRFAYNIHIAEVTDEANYLRVINETARSGEWKAAAWLLEKKYSDTYGSKSKVEMEVAKSQDMSHFTDDELSQMETIYANAKKRN